jgi:hypothetical protein
MHPVYLDQFDRQLSLPTRMPRFTLTRVKYISVLPLGFVCIYSRQSLSFYFLWSHTDRKETRMDCQQKETRLWLRIERILFFCLQWCHRIPMSFDQLEKERDEEHTLRLFRETRRKTYNNTAYSMRCWLDLRGFPDRPPPIYLCFNSFQASLPLLSFSQPFCFVLFFLPER